MQPLTNWVDDLVHCEPGETPDDLFERVAALGERARERLIALATDPAWRGPSAEGGGDAPFRAIELLGALPPDTATATRLVASIVAEPHADEVDAIVDCLAEMEEVAAPPVQAALDAAADRGAAGWLAEALARCRPEGDVTFAALCVAFTRFPGDVADSLASLEDPRAIPLLRRALSLQVVARGTSIRDAEDAVAMADAIERLGGELTEEEAAKRDLALRREAKLLRRQVPRVEALLREPDAELDALRRPGPNDPCPCGSGRKFKKCHEGDADFS